MFVRSRTLMGASLAVAGSLALDGCYYGSGGFERDDDPRPTAPAPRSGSSAGSYYGGPGESLGTEVIEGEDLRGDMGNYTRFDFRGTEVRIQRWTRQASVRVDAENSSTWVMAQLTITGGLDNAALRPGARLHFSGGSPGAGADGQPLFHVAVLGCSGPRRNNYTYDAGATGVDVSVEAGPTPGSRRIRFTATFTGRSAAPQQTTGSFVLDPS